jgi:DNA-binding LacI/PurR family transcriptional regulator
VANATVYDVARKAKVSIATVSRVLNTPDRVMDHTRARVLAAIDALDFVPKAEAAARARQAHRRIGVLAPFLTYPSFVQRLRGVATALQNSTFELSIYHVDSSDRRDGYLDSLSVTRRLDGLIVMSVPFPRATARRLLAHGLDTVLVEFSHPGFTSIEIDDHAGGRMAGEYLLARGHRRLAYIGDGQLPDYAIRASDKRLAGYRQALVEHGLTLDDDYVALGLHDLDRARELTHCLLNLPTRRRRSLPTATRRRWARSRPRASAASPSRLSSPSSVLMTWMSPTISG